MSQKSKFEEWLVEKYGPIQASHIESNIWSKLRFMMLWKREFAYPLEKRLYFFLDRETMQRLKTDPYLVQDCGNRSIYLSIVSDLPYSCNTLLGCKVIWLDCYGDKPFIRHYDELSPEEAKQVINQLQLGPRFEL